MHMMYMMHMMHTRDASTPQYPMLTTQCPQPNAQWGGP
jgi:hypothetical protein